ncbi:MAG: B12-binding domain-containing radical SAM protein [Desulfosalsimonas sp.]|uniref:B12-binding domain-containing radical SAM protein n=1 Tax=Desulfosalsimonas sp. TaxID=3073848 RepID=UPI003971149D
MVTHQNILLVYPEVPSNTYWSYKHALGFIKKKSAMPPLGLLTIAALFPADRELKLVDLNVGPLDDNLLQWADAVFVSAMIVQKQSMEQVVARCNQMGKTVVIGGPYATNSWQELSGADHILRGEVDETLCDFLAELDSGTAAAVYDMPPHPDISRLPAPRFDLLDIDAYGSMSIQYSRGCPFHCEFCDIWTVYGNKPRLKDAQSLTAELDALYSMGWEGAVFLVDDNFIGNKRRVKKELLPALIQWQQDRDYPYHFYTEASINLADDPDLMTGMREAGFNSVFIGIETPDPQSLAETGKTQNLKSDMEAAVRTIQKNGLEVLAGFILGFDNDTPAIFDQQIRFIQQNAIPQAMIGLLNALPGTRLYQRLEAEGRILSQSAGNNTHSMQANFKTVMDPQVLRQGYRKILKHLYGFRLKNYFARCSHLLDRIECRQYYQRKVRAADLKIFFRALLRQPFTAYGFNYIKFLVRNAFKNRDLFAEAVTYSIYGHHYHTITRQTLKKEKIADVLDKKYNKFTKKVNRRSTAVQSGSEDQLRALKKLWDTRMRYLKQMQHKINKLNTDYQDELRRKYLELSAQMRDMLASLEIRTLSSPDSGGAHR